MEQKTLEFWQQHSVNFLTMALKEDKRERLKNPDGYGKYTRECGDTLEFYLFSRDGRIGSASFYTDGCLYTIACANTVVDLIQGKPVDTAWGISPQDISDFLETLPKAEQHCAELAVQALRLALLDLRQTERQPCNKFYRQM